MIPPFSKCNTCKVSCLIISHLFLLKFILLKYHPALVNYFLNAYQLQPFLFSISFSFFNQVKSLASPNYILIIYIISCKLFRYIFNKKIWKTLNFLFLFLIVSIAFTKRIPLMIFYPFLLILGSLVFNTLGNFFGKLSLEFGA